MLRRQPTRIELKEEDSQEYHELKKARQKQNPADKTQTPSALPRKEVRGRIGFDSK